MRGFGWACSSAGEHCIDIAGVTGSIPVTPTIQTIRRLSYPQIYGCVEAGPRECRIFENAKLAPAKLLNSSRLRISFRLHRRYEIWCPLEASLFQVHPKRHPTCRRAALHWTRPTEGRPSRHVWWQQSASIEIRPHRGGDRPSRYAGETRHRSAPSHSEAGSAGASPWQTGATRPSACAACRLASSHRM